MGKVPIPGKPVRGSRSGTPIMALFDLLGRRWAMGVLWILWSQGPCTFRELQNRCGSLSPTVLNTRLKELRQAGLVDRIHSGYCATAMGAELCGLLVPLKTWARGWAAALGPAKD